MKPRSTLWRAVARDSQAWFVIGIFSSGVAVSAWLSIAESFRVTPRMPPLLAVAGCFFLAYAAPYAALRIIEWERDGRLDQLRLTAQAPLRLLVALGLGPALPWLVSGIVFLSAGVWAGGPPAYWWQAVMVIAGAGATVALLTLALPVTRRLTDLRIVMIAAGLYAGAFATIAMNPDRQTAAFYSEHFFSHPWRVAAVLGLQLGIAALCFRGVLAGLARPQEGRTRATAPLRPARGTLPLPAAIRRGAAIGLISAAALTAFVLVIVALVIIAGRRLAGDAAIVAAFLPWIVGAVVITTTTRADAESGRFDVLRLTRLGAMRSAVTMTIDLWAPFLAGSAIIVLAFGIVGREGLRAVDVAYAVIAAVAVAPMALLEGWHRGLMLTYVLPTLFVMVLLMPSTLRLTFADLLSLFAVIWIPWGVAASVLRRGIGVPLDRRFAIVAVAAVVVACDWNRVSEVMQTRQLSAALMILLAGWLAHGGRSWRAQLTLPLVVLATGVLLRIGVRDLTTAALSALLPAVALLCGLRIHQALAISRQPWSLGVRAMLAAVVITIDSAVFRVQVLPRMRGAGSVTAIDFINSYRTGVVIGVVLLVATACVVELATYLAQRRQPRPAVHRAVQP